MAAVNPANVLNLLAGEFHRSSVTNPTARDIEVKDRILGKSSVNRSRPMFPNLQS